MRTLPITIMLMILLAVPVLPLHAQEANALDTVNANLEAGSSNYAAQGFSNDGLYGCKAGNYGSVGLAHARGVFVPVSEESVALNTHTLLYKECILDALMVRIRETMVAFMVKSTFNWVNKNNNGESAFVRNLADNRQRIGDKVVKEFTEGDRTEGLFDGFRRDVRQGLARGYAQATRKPEHSYQSTVPEEKKAEFTQFLKGNGQFKWDMFLLAIQPQNNPIGAYSLALDQLVTDIDEKVSDETQLLDWGQGFKSHKNCKQIPAGNGTYEEYCEIATPGSSIKNIIDYVSLTGHRQTENADEIDELMGSLMSNIHTQILTSAGGLSGISEPSGGGGSYVDRVAGDASARTRTEYTDAGTGLLGSAISTELAYGTEHKGSKEALESTAKQIETKESACWDALIARAQSDLRRDVEQLACDARQTGDFGGSGSDGQCTIRGSVSLGGSSQAGIDTYSDLNKPKQKKKDTTKKRVTIVAKAGTKTLSVTLERNKEHSFATIAQSISPLLRLTNQAVDASDKALTILNNLQSSLANSNTPGNTRFVLEQVDQLVTGGILHKEADIYLAQSQHNKTVDVMERLYKDTVKEWDAGWCNPENWRDQVVN